MENDRRYSPQVLCTTRAHNLLNIRGSVNTFLDYLMLSYVKKGLAKYGGALMATTLRSCISSTLPLAASDYSKNDDVCVALFFERSRIDNSPTVYSMQSMLVS